MWINDNFAEKKERRQTTNTHLRIQWMCVRKKLSQKMPPEKYLTIFEERKEGKKEIERTCMLVKRQISRNCGQLYLCIIHIHDWFEIRKIVDFRWTNKVKQILCVFCYMPPYALLLLLFSFSFLRLQNVFNIQNENFRSLFDGIHNNISWS